MARGEDRRRGGRRGREIDRDGLTPAWLLVGRVLRTHGTRGKILVAPMTDFPERFEPGSRLWIGDDEADLVRVEVVESAPHRVGLRLALARVEEADDAGEDPPDRFVSGGRFLFVSSDELVGAGEGRYYYHELIGCRVETVDGEDVGVVETIIRPGPQDLLIIGGGPRGEVFVPVVEAIVREVDREGRRVVIDPPAGLLDVNVTKC